MNIPYPRIVANPKICHGQPTIEGTRIMVWQILEILEDGGTADEIYSAYPTLPQGAIQAALHYAAEKAKGVRYIAVPRTIQEHAVIPV